MHDTDGFSEPDQREELVRGADLSRRQLECLARAGEGLSSKEIGRALGISPSTVDNHIHAAVAKLHARNRWDAIRLLGPDPGRTGPNPARKRRWFLPIGGPRNDTPPHWRVVQISAIATVSIIVLSALIVLILGALHVFGFG